MTTWWMRPHPALLAVALTLTTATQLRLPGLPLGLGEVLLVGLLAAACGAMVFNRVRWPANHAAIAFSGFWLVAVLGLSVGTWMGAHAGVSRPALLLHDALAYAFALGCSLVLAWLPSTVEEIARRLRWLAAALMLSGSLLWVLAHIEPQVAGVQLWYGGLVGVRFLGWATNPNQLALLLLFAPFLGLFWLGLPDMEDRSLASAGLLVLTAVATAAGWATDSGALRGAWALAVPLLALALLTERRRGGRIATRQIKGLAVVFVLSMLMLQAARWAEMKMQSATTIVADATLSQMKPVLTVVQSHDIPVRADLLRHGAQAWLSSPWFGLGPGSYSGLHQPFQGSEAHNSLLDWATNAGAVGALALLFLGGWVAWRLWRTRQWPLLAALLAVAVFAQAHHVLRHPLFWVWLVLAARWAEMQQTAPQGTPSTCAG